MAGNRVEELEAKVRELEATVDGLTDELVESRERLQVIENEVGIDPDALERRYEQTADLLDADAESASNGDESDEEEASSDDVNTDENEGEDKADSESDDIIVA